MHYGLCLLKLGYAPDCWRDESNPQRIIDTWQRAECPFANADELITACTGVEAAVEEDNRRDEARRLLDETDAVTGARGVEDVVDVLIAEGVIAEGKLPPVLLERINARRLARQILTEGGA